VIIAKNYITKAYSYDLYVTTTNEGDQSEISTSKSVLIDQLRQWCSTFLQTRHHILASFPSLKQQILLPSLPWLALITICGTVARFVTGSSGSNPEHVDYAMLLFILAYKLRFMSTTSGLRN
jgi:hypothetical protein